MSQCLPGLLVGYLLAFGCSHVQSPFFPQEQVDCWSGSKVFFEPALSGPALQYSIEFDSDFGDVSGDFHPPVRCDVVTGDIPLEERTALCSGLPDNVYRNMQGALPPRLMWARSNRVLEGVTWGNESSSAQFLIQRGEEILFDGEVTLVEKTCTSVSGELSYWEGRIQLHEELGQGGSR